MYESQKFTESQFAILSRNIHYIAHNKEYVSLKVATKSIMITAYLFLL